MEVYEGKAVLSGIAIGKVLIYRKNHAMIKRAHIDDAEAELARFHEAKDTVMIQLKELHDKAVEEIGEDGADIFQAHQLMLEDLDYLESIENMIHKQNINAEYAVASTADNFSKMFAAMGDIYMKERAADIKDISEC